MTTKEIIGDFYSHFQQGNAEGMVKHYHDDVVFEDPAFGVLRGDEAKNMWRMLLASAKDLEVTYNYVQGCSTEGCAHWEAKYTFSKTGRKVHNKIRATFEFQDGKIISHRDQFNFWKWSQMALGPFGLFFGYAPFVKNKVRTTALESLQRYTESNQ